MNAEHVRDELSAYISGNLSAETSDRIREHLASCESCRSEFLALNTLWESLAQLPDETPDESVRFRFYEMLRGAQARQSRAPARASIPGAKAGGDWLKSVFAKRPIFQVALAAVTLAIGVVLGYQLRGEPTGGAEFTQLHQEILGISRLLTVSLLQQQSASERLRGVSWSYRMGEPDAEITQVLLQTLRYDPNVNVRLAALDALSRNSSRSDIRADLIQLLPRQSSPLVQVAMINLLIQAHDKGSIDTLRRMVRDPELNQVVKKKIEDGIRQLS